MPSKQMLQLVNVIILLITFGHAKVSANVLECYQCDDCNGNEKLISCTYDTTPEPEATKSSTGDTTPERVVTTTTSAHTTLEPVITTTTSTLEPVVTIQTTVETTSTMVDETELPSTTTAAVISTTSTSEEPEQRRYRCNSDITFACYTLSFKADNGKSTTKKGCVAKDSSQSACAVAESQVNATVEKCIPCLNSKCNSSAAIRLPIGVAIGCIVLICKNFGKVY